MPASEPQPQSSHRTDDVRVQIGRVNVGDGRCNLPQSAQDQISHSSDTSIPLFALYLRGAEKADWKKSKDLKEDLDQIIIFIRHKISEVVRVWLISLLGSIFCAALAISIERSTRPTSMVTSPRYSLPQQARLHALHANGFKWFKSFHLIKLFHLLIHLSFFAFLIGLVTYFNTFNVTDANVVLEFYTVIYVLYLLVTAIPVFKPGAPLSTPFSPLFAICYAFLARMVARLYYWATWPIRFCASFVTKKVICPKPRNYNRGWSMSKVAEDRAHELGPRFDADILNRTLDMLRSDNDLEEFFDSIPGFFDSKIVHHRGRSLGPLGQQRLAGALIGFWNLPESTKGQRLLVCMGAIEAANLASAAPGTICGLSFRYLGGVTRSVELGHSLGNLRDGNAASLARGIIAAIISNAERNDRWNMLAIDELGISRNVLQGYLAHGDSVLLANLIHITRHFFDGLLQDHPDLTREALSVLPSVSKFDIHDTLPELQHDFCALWNDVVQRQTGHAESNSFKEILYDIWGLYVALHGTTASKYNPMRPPASYPLCEDDSHSNLTTHVQ
ncbi:hypothetical protein BGY98DRAFT_933190 [Russula aff. rugulosa BPL654]|nr:hypothetical protein BGY98DRAFT_933190 [Russula aff. rugulosa BPL654]